MTTGLCQGFCMDRARCYLSLFGAMSARCVNQLLAEKSPLLILPDDQSSGPAILSVEILRLGAPTLP
jgi:hypothetical protein